MPNDHSQPITKFPMKMRSLWEGKTYTKNTTSPLNLCYILKRGLDLSILKIWGLLVKGLQSYQLSKLEVTRKSLPTGPGPSWYSRPGFELYQGQIIKVWRLVTLYSTKRVFSAFRTFMLNRFIFRILFHPISFCCQNN